MSCNILIPTGFSHYQAEQTGDGTTYTQCGEWYAGKRILCDFHIRQAKRRFPQGWAYTPGDTCPHGVYIGGLMEDYMCGRCEMGD